MDAFSSVMEDYKRSLGSRSSRSSTVSSLSALSITDSHNNAVDYPPAIVVYTQGAEASPARTDADSLNKSLTVSGDSVHFVAHSDEDVAVPENSKTVDSQDETISSSVQSASIASSAMSINQRSNVRDCDAASSVSTASPASWVKSLLTRRDSVKSMTSVDSQQADSSYKTGSPTSLSSFDQSEEFSDDKLRRRTKGGHRRVKASLIDLPSTENDQAVDSDSKYSGQAGGTIVVLNNVCACESVYIVLGHRRFCVELWHLVTNIDNKVSRPQTSKLMPLD